MNNRYEVTLYLSAEYSNFKVRKTYIVNAQNKSNAITRAKTKAKKEINNPLNKKIVFETAEIKLLQHET